MTIWGPILNPGGRIPGKGPPQNTQPLYDGTIREALSDGLYTVELRDGSWISRVSGPTGLSIGDSVVVQKGPGGEYVINSRTSKADSALETVWV